VEFPQETAIGSMAYYITHAEGKHFQPMNANYGLFPELPERIRDKKARYEAIAQRALKANEAIKTELEKTAIPNE
ncbi:methylenetetrahydrofolate--tRNA-(uracil(54)-C(5))-methyltransferase (FADH(2)-oxidizing) TrmFO, partial [Enterococcus faecalis]